MNSINPIKLLQLRNSWDQFKLRHPKLPPFLNAVTSGAVREGTIIDISVTMPDGKIINSNLRITSEDIQLLDDVKELMNTTQQS